MPLTGGTADASAISAGRGRGTARPDRIAVASVVRMAPASSELSFQFVGGNRIWVRGMAFGCSARHSIEPSASWRRAVSESCCSRIASAEFRYGGATGSEPVAPNAAPTAGSNGASTTCGDSRRGEVSAVGGIGVFESPAAVSAAAITTVLLLALNRSTALRVNEPSGIRVAPRTDGDAEDLVDDVGGSAGGGRAEPGVADPLHGVEVGLGVGERCDARPVRQRPQPVQPAHRRGLPGARVGGGAWQLRGTVGRSRRRHSRRPSR